MPRPSARRTATRWLAGLIGLALVGATASASAAPIPTTEELIDAALKSRGIPGAQVVHRKGTTTESYTYGVQSAATQVPVTSDTMFQAASLSKVTGAYLALKRVDQGKLDLDKPLWDYFESPRTEGNAQARTVTARMVLNHTTGFPNWAGAVNSEAPALIPAFTPGSKFGYSGDGFALLQATIEHIDGKLVADSLQDEVFTPFGMADTSLVYRPADEARMIVGHDAAGVPGVIGKWTKGNIAYTLHTSAEDYTTFLKRAVIDGEGLTPATHKAWLAYSSDADAEADNPANPAISWGLGIGRESNELGEAVWHWGDNGSRRAFFLAFPDRDESVAMFFNSASGQLAASDILRAFYGDLTYNSVTWVGDYDETPAPSIPQSDAWPELSAAIEPIIAEASAAGVDLGVALEDLSGHYGRRSLFLGKQDRSTTASVIKIALAATVLHQVETGRISLSDSVTITKDEIYGGSGSLQNRPLPITVTVGEMLELMITISDNTATNKLVDVVGGFAPINATIAAAGVDREDLHFGRKMWGDIIPPDGDVWLTPYGVNGFLTALYETARPAPAARAATSDFLTQASAQKLIDLMLAQQVQTKLGAVIPASVLAHKTGENDTVSHDVGFVLLPGQEVTLSVFSTRGAGFEGDMQATAVPFVQRVGEQVYAYLLKTAPEKPQPSPSPSVNPSASASPSVSPTAPVSPTPSAVASPTPGGRPIGLPNTGVAEDGGAASLLGALTVLGAVCLAARVRARR